MADDVTRPPPSLGRSLAAELDGVAGAIEVLAERLCCDPVVFARHAGPLQSFDLVTQVIGEIAALLRRPDEGGGGAVLADIRLDALRTRLSANLQGAQA